MIIIMRPNASPQQIADVLKHIEREGLRAHLSRGQERTIIGVIGTDRRLDPTQWTVLDGVENAVRVTRPYKLASREMHPENTIIEIGDVRIGGEEVVVMAGPCSVESREQILETARAARAAGARALRGGAFKPRTSPYSFQGLGEEGLKYLAEAREETGLLIVTEVMSPEQVELVSRYADILQVGARNTQNYALLNAVGRANKPVLLKRGLSGTIVELLMSAEYIMSNGNLQVMLCERGIRTYETETRNTFDLNAIPVLHRLSHLPVIADPSHGVGKWEYVSDVTKGALAAGSDGLIIEIHPDPASAMSDGGQSLTPKNFAALMDDLRLIARAIGRRVADPQAGIEHIRRVA
ncbi:MAG TPA: 3-deoxy-7-phosphoheptulonate synthase [Ardenticatenaceae bacterium]|nr:3-deoxy-7-phosphoheptulonate synthase [Ardenticatenaceae bacterium]